MLRLRQPLLVLVNFWMFPIQISLVIASEQPQKLSEFYAFAMNSQVSVGKTINHWVIKASESY